MQLQAWSFNGSAADRRRRGKVCHAEVREDELQRVRR